MNEMLTLTGDLVSVALMNPALASVAAKLPFENATVYADF